MNIFYKINIFGKKTNKFFFSKIKILKWTLFWQSQHFWQEPQFLTKIKNFHEINQIFDKNQIFWHKWTFLTKMKIFVKKHKILQLMRKLEMLTEIKFLAKIKILRWKTKISLKHCHFINFFLFLLKTSNFIGTCICANFCRKK